MPIPPIAGLQDISPDPVETMRHQGRPCADAGRCRGRLSPGVTTADDDHVAFLFHVKQSSLAEAEAREDHVQEPPPRRPARPGSQATARPNAALPQMSSSRAAPRAAHQARPPPHGGPASTALRWRTCDSPLERCRPLRNTDAICAKHRVDHLPGHTRHASRRPGGHLAFASRTIRPPAARPQPGKLFLSASTRNSRKSASPARARARAMPAASISPASSRIPAMSRTVSGKSVEVHAHLDHVARGPGHLRGQRRLSSREEH